MGERGEEVGRIPGVDNDDPWQAIGPDTYKGCMIGSMEVVLREEDMVKGMRRCGSWA